MNNETNIDLTHIDTSNNHTVVNISDSAYKNKLKDESNLTNNLELPQYAKLKKKIKYYI